MRLIRLALGRPAPALHELAKTLRDQGMKQAPMYQLFSRVYQETPTDHAHIDALLDVMDCIWGGPWAKGKGLFDTELNTGEISG